MADLIRAPRFQGASMATAERVIRLLRSDAVAFGDERLERPARLTAEERLTRLRQRAADRG